MQSHISIAIWPNIFSITESKLLCDKLSQNCKIVCTINRINNQSYIYNRSYIFGYITDRM